MKKAVVLGAGCILLVALASVADAQGRGGRGGFARSRMSLVGIEQVQTALNLTDEQKEKIQEIAEEARPTGGGEGGRPNFDPEAMRAAEAKIMDLLDDKQKKRLTGIYVQSAGAQALLDDGVSKALEIDDDLKEEIRSELEAVQGEMRDKARAIFEESGDDRDAAMKKFQELRAEADKQVLALLSDAQQKAFDELKGEKVELPPMGRGMGGGRQGGGGRPDGGGGDQEARPRRPGGGGGDGGGDGGGGGR